MTFHRSITNLLQDTFSRKFLLKVSYSQESVYYKSTKRKLVMEIFFNQKAEHNHIKIWINYQHSGLYPCLFYLLWFLTIKMCFCSLMLVSIQLSINKRQNTKFNSYSLAVCSSDCKNPVIKQSLKFRSSICINHTQKNTTNKKNDNRPLSLNLNLMYC